MNYEIGQIVKGTITGIIEYGIFVKLENNYKGLIHISEISNSYIKDIKSRFNKNDKISAKIIGINTETKTIKLSLKQIDLLLDKNISKIPESGSGFRPLEKRLPKWTKFKINEISNEHN